MANLVEAALTQAKKKNAKRNVARVKKTENASPNIAKTDSLADQAIQFAKAKKIAAQKEARRHAVAAKKNRKDEVFVVEDRDDVDAEELMHDFHPLEVDASPKQQRVASPTKPNPRQQVIESPIKETVDLVEDEIDGDPEKTIPQNSTSLLYKVMRWTLIGLVCFLFATALGGLESDEEEGLALLLDMGERSLKSIRDVTTAAGRAVSVIGSSNVIRDEGKSVMPVSQVTDDEDDLIALMVKIWSKSHFVRFFLSMVIGAFIGSMCP